MPETEGCQPETEGCQPETEGGQPAISGGQPTAAYELPLYIKELDLKITDLFQMGDGRMEVVWEPVDRPVDDEIEYMAVRMDKPIGRTQKDIIRMNDMVHYLFDDKGLWRGIRCPKEMWEGYLQSKGYQDVPGFMKFWLISPMKNLQYPEAKRPIVIG